MRSLRGLLVAFAWAVLVPSAVFAQASITGVVKDSSGGVLPGVTVEAESPALIEKVRSSVTDDSGQFRIVDLRPGTYTVTFSLPGFTTVKREGIALTGSFTATVNADLRVGELQETITVTGEAPTVDVQSTTRQRVMDSETIDAIPTGRNEYNLAQLIPGVQTTGGLANQDVGGALGHETFELAVHGSKGDSQRVTMNGVSIGTIVGGGTRAGSVPNPQSFQEIAIDTSGASAELPTGGVRINFIPREGGNTFKGSFFGSFADDSFQGNNFSERVQSRGLASPNLIKKNWDVNPGLGGPIRRDKVWFYVSGRYNGTQNYAAGIFDNLNANNPNAWTYEPDRNSRPSIDAWWQDAQARVTWQANQKNKVSFSYDYQVRLTKNNQIGPTVAPEASNDRDFPLQRLMQVDWSSPLNSRVLLEASIVSRVERWGFMHPHEAFVLDPAMIPVVEQSTGLTYRAGRGNGTRYNNAWVPNTNYRAAASYITGSHAIKVGFNDGFGTYYNRSYDLGQPFTYRFNQGVPNQLTMYATPYNVDVNLDHDLGIYAQDKWTMGRLALSLGVRYDYFANSFPELNLGPAPLVPARNLTIPETDNLSWHDITPKMGVVYDLSGSGRTALKVSLNKYLQGMATNGLASDPNPMNRLVLSTTRSWSDANRNFSPDCDLLTPAANGECGALADVNFGKDRPSTNFNPELFSGWGIRNYNWEFSGGVQHEIIPRVSVDVAYFRRWYGNFFVTDNLAVTAADFDQFSITAPGDARLPEGGGYAIGGFYNVNPAKFGQADNYVTFADEFGTQIERWNGVDVNATARLQNGLIASGGLSTGGSFTDNCEIVAKLPESNPLGAPFCRQDQNWTTQVKGFVAYTLPRVDVQVSGTFQSYPGPEIAANYNAPNAVIAPSLGRNLSGGAANATVNLVAPGTLFGDRVNQLDLRFGKIVRLGRTRSAINVDLYNALNTDAILTQNNTFGAVWQRPTLLLPARFVKISYTLDF